MCLLQGGKVHGETVALAQPSLGGMDPGEGGHDLGCCGQFTNSIC